MISCKMLGAVAAIAISLAQTPVALAMDAPTGDVVLTVSGALDGANDGDRMVFDIAMLEALDTVTFQTTTPWTEGTQTFTGASLTSIMAALGVTEGMISATAINDYSVDIPVSDAVEGGPIVAYLRNGEPMPRREKGPLWIVYPYDSNQAYQAEVIYSRSIWQLNRIDVAR